MRRAWLGVLAFAAGLGFACGAAAQGARGFQAGPPGNFDYYLLALSWSPTFCEFAERRQDSYQCEPERRLGLVVHGLWPQLEQGRLEDCADVTRPPSRTALAEAAGLFPNEGLARHEWRKHGTCTGKSPAEYFRDVRRAWERLRIPERLAKASEERRASLREIERAFRDANPGLRADMMEVACRRNRLQEIRVCFDRDLREFRSCPRSRSNCPVDDIVVTGAP